MPRSAQLGATPFAVVDVETTGVYWKTDRIVEVAVQRLRSDGTVEDEYETLVNPRRDVGPTEIHHITASDVANAPAFGEVAADIYERLQGAVVVGHNLRFDLGFLSSEYGRLQIYMPDLPQLCTVRLASQFLPVPVRSLADCCCELGVEHRGVHTALGDARATGQVLNALIEAAREEGLRNLEDLGCTPLDFPPQWLTDKPTGKRVSRSDASRMATEARGYLARLVTRMAGDEATSADEAEYMEVLDRVLSDRAVTPDEATLLMQVAGRIGLSRMDAERAHRAYMQGLVAAAWADGTVTDVELQDIVLVGELLGVTQREVFALVERRPANKTQAGKEDLHGKMVCFTGSLEEFQVRGETLTREYAHFLASQAGLHIWPRVTKKIDILVVADANTLSGKAQKAREYGTRIMAAPAFFSAIGVSVER